MFLTKKRLSRRTILRGGGAAIALPFLDSMVPAGASAASDGTHQKLAFIEALPRCAFEFGS
jgi:hypothetical protein